jgi:pimeloyl-ACP methyl ester carboxylesterase
VSGASLGRIALEIDGDGPPIVFLHGLGATSSAFQPLLDSLHGFRCIRPDLPGAGRSERPCAFLSMDVLVRSALEIVRMVAGRPVHLVAHSMGTLIAQHTAVAAPEMVLSLILFGPIGEPTDAVRERLRDRARLVRRDGMIAVADAIAAAGISTATKLGNPVAFAYVRESHLRQDGEGFAQSCDALAGAKGADLGALKCPTLLVTGEDDPVAPPAAAQALADKIRSAKLRVLPRCGHWTPLEQPKECARLASEHIQATRPRL